MRPSPRGFGSGFSSGFAPEKGAATRRSHALEFRRGDRVKAIALACARVLAACAVSAAIGLGAYQGFQWATQSSLFAVRAVRVRGAVHAPAPELIARSGLLAGQNLFRVDLAAAARGVESSPWISAASVSRQLPSSIEIEVREHTPVARVQLGAPYFTDAEGHLFKRVNDEDDAAARALPLITGLARADWGTRPDDALMMRAAIQLVADWRDAGLNADELSEVRVNSDGALTAIASTQEIRVGHGPFAANLHRLLRVRAELARRGESASRIDLDNPARPDEVAAQIVRNDESNAASARPKVASARGE